MSPEQFQVRKPIVASAVTMFKSAMMAHVGEDLEDELFNAEYERKATIFAYDLTVAETAAFNREIGYTPPLN